MNRRTFIGTTLVAAATPFLSEEMAVAQTWKLGERPWSRSKRYKAYTLLAQGEPYKTFVDQVVESVNDKFLSTDHFQSTISKRCHPRLRAIYWGDRKALCRQAVVLGDVFLKINWNHELNEIKLVNMPPERMWRVETPGGRLLKFTHAYGSSDVVVDRGTKFTPDQIVHIAPVYFHNRYNPYGCSALQLAHNENGIEIAANRIFHYLFLGFVRVASQGELLEWQ